MRESEARSCIATETVADAVGTVEAPGRLSFVNRVAESMIGHATKV